MMHAVPECSLIKVNPSASLISSVFNLIVGASVSALQAWEESFFRCFFFCLYFIACMYIDFPGSTSISEPMPTIEFHF